MTRYRLSALILLCSISLHGSTLAQQKKESHLYITGAVRKSGAYKFEGRPTVLQLIQAAGGLTDEHGSTAIIIRESQNLDEIRQKRIDINSLTKGVITEDSYLQPGDIIFVPTVPLFYVVGEVNSPGSFSYKEGMTLRQAISLAQGTTFNAVRERVCIIREDAASGKRQEINVDLGEVMKGKKEDVAIEPYDILVVPSSKSKSLNDLPRLIDTPPLRGMPSRQNGSDKKG
jgi:polysaccharide export outer membrane protein